MSGLYLSKIGYRHKIVEQKIFHPVSSYSMMAEETSNLQASLRETVCKP